MEEFHTQYQPKLVEAGLMTPSELSASLAVWREPHDGPPRRCVTPTMADVVLRKR